MQAITTKYIPATNFRGSRIKASCQAGSIILHWDDSMNSENNHRNAAMQLAGKLGWHGQWYGGGMPDGKGDVFVCADSHFSSSFNIPKVA